MIVDRFIHRGFGNPLGPSYTHTIISCVFCTYLLSYVNNMWVEMAKKLIFSILAAKSEEKNLVDNLIELWYCFFPRRKHKRKERFIFLTDATEKKCYLARPTAAAAVQKERQKNHFHTKLIRFLRLTLKANQNENQWRFPPFFPLCFRLPITTLL